MIEDRGYIIIAVAATTAVATTVAVETEAMGARVIDA
jgi:hypothetical protein